MSLVLHALCLPRQQEGLGEGSLGPLAGDFAAKRPGLPERPVPSRPLCIEVETNRKPRPAPSLLCGREIILLSLVLAGHLGRAHSLVSGEDQPHMCSPDVFPGCAPQMCSPDVLPRCLGTRGVTWAVAGLSRLHRPLVCVSGGVCSPAGPVPSLRAGQGPLQCPGQDVRQHECGFLLPGVPAHRARCLRPLPEPRDRWEEPGLRPRQEPGGQVSLPREAVPVGPLLPLDAPAEEHGGEAGQKQAQGHDLGHR